MNPINMNSIHVKFLVSLALAVLNSVPVFPCGCVGQNAKLSLWEEIRLTDVVFVGRPVSVRQIPISTLLGSYTVEYRFAIDLYVKGPVGIWDTVSVVTASGPNACGVQFESGSHYLVYAAWEGSPAV